MESINLFTPEDVTGKELEIEKKKPSEGKGTLLYPTKDKGAMRAQEKEEAI